MIDEDLLAILKEMARRQDRSVSSLVRMLVRRELDRGAQPAKPTEVAHGK